MRLNVSVQARPIGCLLALFSVTLGLGGFCHHRMSEPRVAASDLGDEASPSARIVGRLATSFEALRSRQLAYLFSNPQRRPASLGRLRETMAGIETDLKEYAPLVSPGEEALREAIGDSARLAILLALAVVAVVTLAISWVATVSVPVQRMAGVMLRVAEGGGTAGRGDAGDRAQRLPGGGRRWRGDRQHRGRGRCGRGDASRREPGARGLLRAVAPVRAPHRRGGPLPRHRAGGVADLPVRCSRP